MLSDVLFGFSEIRPHHLPLFSLLKDKENNSSSYFPFSWRDALYPRPQSEERQSMRRKGAEPEPDTLTKRLGKAHELS